MPSAKPDKSCIPASSISGRLSIIVDATATTVSTTEGIKVGNAFPRPVAIVTMI